MAIGTQGRPPVEHAPVMLACDVCGHEGLAGREVSPLLIWGGDPSPRVHNSCVNKPACWARRERSR